MRAAVIDDFGDADRLRIQEVEEPSARPGWVTVRLEASGLNWHDVLVRRGTYSSPLPHIMGADGAGVRTDTGQEVMINPSLWWGKDERAPAEGWEILGDTTPGTYAECVQVPEEAVVPKPTGLSWEQAAALPLAGLTAYRALVTRARLTSGESLLILGAGGGVSTVGVGLAAAIGAEVWVTSSRETSIRGAMDLGARGGVIYRDADWTAQARRVSPGGRGFDVVLDSVGLWRDSLTALRPGGRLVVLGSSQAEQVQLDVRPFYFGQYDLLGTTMGSPQDLAAMLDLMGQPQTAAPPIREVLALDEIRRAHRLLESGGGFGKIVLRHR